MRLLRAWHRGAGRIPLVPASPVSSRCGELASLACLGSLSAGESRIL